MRETFLDTWKLRELQKNRLPILFFKLMAYADQLFREITYTVRLVRQYESDLNPFLTVSLSLD